MGKMGAWPDWFYNADIAGYVCTIVASGLTTLLLLFTLCGLSKSKPLGLPAALVGRACALFLGLNQAFDLGLHLPRPAHWPHTLANVLVFGVAMQYLVAPGALSDRAAIIVSGVLGVVYSDLMQAANIMWLLGGLCEVESAQDPSYWLQPGLGMQGSVLALLGGTTFYTLQARWEPEKNMH
jgi:hypothetical protein